MTKHATSSISASRGQALRVSACLLALLCGLFVVDRGAAMTLRFIYQYSDANPRVLVERIEPDTLVVGSSTGKYAFHPDAWPGAMLNLAQNGQSFLYSLAMTLSVQGSESLERIIIALDPSDLLSGIENRNVERIWRIAPLITDHAVLSDLLAETRPTLHPAQYIESWAFRGQVPDILLSAIRPVTPHYEALPVLPKTLPNIQKTSKGRSPTINRSLDKYVKALRTYLENSSQKVIFVVTPAYGNLRSNLYDQNVLIDELLRKLPASNICDLTSLDSEAFWNIARTHEFFNEGPHMSEAGAVSYTKAIHDQITKKCS